MPSTEMKVKSGAKYPVKYSVAGALSDLTREQVESLAIKQLRMSARNFCVQKLNEAEPAIVNNQIMLNNMVAAGLTDQETAVKFFAASNMPLEIPSVFEIPLSELLPSDSGRGKKAANIFSLEAEEGEDDTDDDADETTTE